MASAEPPLDEVEVHTDGACSGNPGPGGWAAVLCWRGHRREISGYDPLTTNNRMELQAAIAALEALKRPARVRIITDSTYLRHGITAWLANWKRRGWMTADKKPVKNRDLWERLERALGTHDITWEWVKGHAGAVENERADELARLAIKKGGPSLEA